MPEASRLPKIVIISGPTGAGKTGFAVELAGYFTAEIVGADSMQIYQGMDIGTAKPTSAEQAAVRHHMVDILPPDQPFDAAAYGCRARKVVGELLSRGVLPFVVGGTGLYIKALVYGLFDTRRADPGIRRDLQQQAAREGSAALHRHLAGIDPRAALRIHPNDTYRIIRALEVAAATGDSISARQHNHGFARPCYEALTIGIQLPREELYARIDRRVDLMLSAGLKDEVARLLALGLSPELKSMQALGYRHMAAYLQGRCSWDEAVRTLKRDHRRYAKRQLTWFGALQKVHWLLPTQVAEARRMVDRFLG